MTVSRPSDDSLQVWKNARAIEVGRPILATGIVIVTQTPSILPTSSTPMPPLSRPAHTSPHEAAETSEAMEVVFVGVLCIYTPINANPTEGSLGTLSVLTEFAVTYLSADVLALAYFIKHDKDHVVSHGQWQRLVLFAFWWCQCGVGNGFWGKVPNLQRIYGHHAITSVFMILMMCIVQSLCYSEPVCLDVCYKMYMCL